MTKNHVDCQVAHPFRKPQVAAGSNVPISRALLATERPLALKSWPQHLCTTQMVNAVKTVKTAPTVKNVRIVSFKTVASHVEPSGAADVKANLLECLRYSQSLEGDPETLNMALRKQEEAEAYRLRIQKERVKDFVRNNCGRIAMARRYSDATSQPLIDVLVAMDESGPNPVKRGITKMKKSMLAAKFDSA